MAKNRAGWVQHGGRPPGGSAARGRLGGILCLLGWLGVAAASRAVETNAHHEAQMYFQGEEKLAAITNVEKRDAGMLLDDDPSAAPLLPRRLTAGEEPVLLKRVTDAGLKHLRSEEDGSYTWEDRLIPVSSPAPTLTVSDLFLKDWLRIPDGNGWRGVPEVRLTLQEQRAPTDPLVRKFELGLSDPHIWLVHERQEDDMSSTGIELKKDW